MVYFDWLSLWTKLRQSDTNSTYEDVIGGEPLPNCPENDTVLWNVFHHPTVLFTEVILGVLCCVFAIIIAVNYNSVRVFNRKIRTPPISNTLWIFYFLTVALRAMFDAFRYGLDVADIDDLTNLGFYLSSLVMFGICTLMLTLSLNHQKKYRSAGAIQQTNKQEPQHPPPSKSKVAMSILLSAENIYFLFFALYLVFLYLETSSVDKHDIYFYLFAGMCVLQFSPIIVLTLMIIMNNSNYDGPSKLSKNLVFFGTLLNMAMVFPPTLWAYWLPADCYLYFASLTDVFQWLHILSLILYYFFIREEYKRNMEECIWTTVSQIQDTFDFRRF